jgi:hypothetical protein
MLAGVRTHAGGATLGPPCGGRGRQADARPSNRGDPSAAIISRGRILGEKFVVEAMDRRVDPGFKPSIAAFKASALPSAYAPSPPRPGGSHPFQLEVLRLVLEPFISACKGRL